ncbi:hypothetical protein Pelo_1930 [Pelomyxa schiedti]|nr:hypothetical protein Pelo_1930 [Pelomyxa schiedti]
MASVDMSDTSALLSPHTALTILEAIFRKYDADANHKLDLHELRNLFYDLGFPLTPTEAATLLTAMDLDHDGFVQFNELCTWWRGSEKYRAIPAHIVAARATAAKYFAKYDTDRNGVLDLTELTKLWIDLGAAGIVRGTSAWDAMLSADANRDKTIQMSEFIELVLKNYVVEHIPDHVGTPASTVNVGFFEILEFV